jgi:hypothetical protein
LTTTAYAGATPSHEIPKFSFASSHGKAIIMMLSPKLWFVFSTSFACATAQEPLEAHDFNITNALIANGVKLSSIPGIIGLAEHSIPKSCELAVSRPFIAFSPYSTLTLLISAYRSPQSSVTTRSRPLRLRCTGLCNKAL